MNTSWRTFFWRTAMTGLVLNCINVVTSLWLFRLLFNHLSREAYGIYVFLWSLAGYSLLLDFGLGYTAQKVTAEKLATGDVPGLNQFLATAFWLLAAIGAVQFGVAMACAPLVADGVGITAALSVEFRSCYALFMGAIALSFPLAFLPQVVVGAQRLHEATTASIAANLGNAVVMTWGVSRGWGLTPLLATSVLAFLFPFLVCVGIMYRRIPGISLSWRHIRPRALASNAAFSSSTYKIACSDFLMTRTDQVVIGFWAGVHHLRAYQLGFKGAEIFRSLGAQFLRALSPAAAQMQAESDRCGQRALLQGGLRMMLLLFPIYAFLVVYLDSGLRLISGAASVDPSSVLVGRLLLTAAMSTLITDHCAAPLLVMSGHERVVARIKMAAAVGNLVLSVILVRAIGLAGVAVGTLVPALVAGWLGIVPLTLRFMDRAGWELCREAGEPVGMPIAFALALLACSVAVPVSPGVVDLALRGSIVMVPLVAVALRLARELVAPRPAPRVFSTWVEPLVDREA